MPNRFLVKKFVNLLLLVLVLIVVPAEASPETQQHLKSDFMFKTTNVKSVLIILADQMKVNLIFDSSVKDSPIEFEGKDISMREAFDKLLEQGKLASLPLDRNIIVVCYDAPEIVQRVQEMAIWVVTDFKQGRSKNELLNDDWLKMLKESSRKESLRKYNLKDVSLKTAVTTLAKQLDYVVMFDESVKNEKIDLVFSSATPIRVVENVFSSQKLRARILGERTIVVFSDSDDKYEKLSTWTANLSVKN